MPSAAIHSNDLSATFIMSTVVVWLISFQLQGVPRNMTVGE